MDHRTHRRAVLATGARLAYAAPVVAASMAIPQLAGAELTTETACDCYDASLGFRWVSNGNGGGPIEFGICATCAYSAREPGSSCPDNLQLFTSTGHPGCHDPDTRAQISGCGAVTAPICGQPSW